MIIFFWNKNSYYFALKMTFTEAYHRLQEIHQMLQSSDVIDVEELVKLQEEAKVCYDLCQSMLQKTTSSS